jgi:hypothetical protein
MFKRSLAIREKTLGAENPSVADSLSNLGPLYSSQSRYADAEPLFKRSLAIRERAFGADHVSTAEPLVNLASLYTVQKRYADAEPLYQRSRDILERSLGPNHWRVGFVLNNLAELYLAQSRYSDALSLARTAADRGFPRKSVYLAALTLASAKSIIKEADAFNEGYQLVQRESLSAASGAINQLAVRFAAGNSQLAALVRAEQDLASERERLDTLIVEAVSKDPSKRNAANEQKIRDRLQSIASQRAQIQNELHQKFPDYAALSKPSPLSVKETQALLADDEVLVVFDFDVRSYAGIFTRSQAGSVVLNITARDLDAQVKAIRSSLEDETQSFDLNAAYKLYQILFGGFAEHIASKTRLYVVSNGRLPACRCSF